MPISNRKLEARRKNFESQLKARRNKGNSIDDLEEKIYITKLQQRRNQGLHYDSPLLRKPKRRFRHLVY